MYQLPEFLDFSEMVHAFSTKAEGNMDYRFGNKNQVMKNRRKFLSGLGISMDNCVFMSVQHGDTISEVDENSKGLGVYTFESALLNDALITNIPNIYPVLLVADCAPIILYERERKALALVHVGWKGADLKVIPKSIDMMKKIYNISLDKLVAGIGPAIRKNSYIKKDPQQKNYPEWESYLKRIGKNKYEVNFVGYAVNQLIDSGVLEGNVFDSYIDTFHDDRFYSLTYESNLSLLDQGRFACVVGLK